MKAPAAAPAGRAARSPEAIQQAISEMVQLSSEVIEEQIRVGRDAAERLRDGFANSRQLNTDVTTLVEGLVATTKDVGATWLDVLAIVVRSIGTQPGSSPHAPGTPGPGGTTRTSSSTTTLIGKSGGAETISSMTPANPASEGVPPVIVVTGARVKSVRLDLRPPSARFVPVVRALVGADPTHNLTSVRLTLSADRTHLVLNVDVPRGQPADNYAGVVVDSTTNEPGGTIGVIVDG